MPLSNEDYAYFMDRAELELELAQRAQHPKVVAAHYALAERYLGLVFGAPSRAPSENMVN